MVEQEWEVREGGGSRRVWDGLQVKARVMELMGHSDPEVRYESLKAVQEFCIVFKFSLQDIELLRLGSFVFTQVLELVDGFTTLLDCIVDISAHCRGK